MKLDMLFQKNVRIIIDKNFFELERFDFSLRVYTTNYASEAASGKSLSQ